MTFSDPEELNQEHNLSGWTSVWQNWVAKHRPGAGIKPEKQFSRFLSFQRSNTEAINDLA
jgi:hypothetical protein